MKAAQGKLVTCSDCWKDDVSNISQSCQRKYSGQKFISLMSSTCLIPGLQLVQFCSKIKNLSDMCYTVHQFCGKGGTTAVWNYGLIFFTFHLFVCKLWI